MVNTVQTAQQLPRATAAIDADPREIAARIISDNGGVRRPDLPVIKRLLDALSAGNDDLGRQVRAEVERALGPVKAGELARATYTLGSGPGAVTIQDGAPTVAQYREMAAGTPGRAQYMRWDTAFGDGRYATNDVVRIDQAIREMQASGMSVEQYLAVRQADQASWTEHAGNFLASMSLGGRAMEAMQPVVASLGRSAGLDNTVWGGHLQRILDTPGSARAFNAGVASGLLEGAQGFVVSVATLAGRAIQYSGDTSVSGRVGDGLRSAVPDSVKNWLRDAGVGDAMNEVLPSAQRGAASNAALQRMGTSVGEYFASRSAGQVATDVQNAIGRIWSSVEGDHAAARARGPEAEARWFGTLVGRVTFEVASTFVPVAGVAGKVTGGIRAADRTVDALRVGDAATDALRLEETVRRTAGTVDDVVDGARVAQAAAVTQRTIGQNTVRWTVDAEGRLTEASASLREVFTGLTRSPAEVRAQGEAAARGIAGDHGGHAVPHRFVRDQGGINMFPQNGVPVGALRNFNGSAFKTLENELADWVGAGGRVEYRVSFSDFVGARPSTVDVRYEVFDAAGRRVYRNSDSFANEAGQTFTRVTRSEVGRMMQAGGQ